MMNSTGSPGSTGQSPDKLPLVTPGRKLVPRRLHSTPDYTKINLGTLSQDCLNDLDDDDKQRLENLKASVGEDWKQVPLSTVQGSWSSMQAAYDKHYSSVQSGGSAPMQPDRTADVVDMVKKLDKLRRYTTAEHQEEVVANITMNKLFKVRRTSSMLSTGATLVPEVLDGVELPANESESAYSTLDNMIGSKIMLCFSIEKWPELETEFFKQFSVTIRHVYDGKYEEWKKDMQARMAKVDWGKYSSTSWQANAKVIEQFVDAFIGTPVMVYLTALLLGNLRFYTDKDHRLIMQDEDFIAAVMNVKADSLRRYTQLSEEMEKARGEYMAAGTETALLVPLREGRMMDADLKEAVADKLPEVVRSVIKWKFHDLKQYTFGHMIAHMICMGHMRNRYRSSQSGRR